jgi:hypothetical protein
VQEVVIQELESGDFFEVMDRGGKTSPTFGNEGYFQYKTTVEEHKSSILVPD